MAQTFRTACKAKNRMMSMQFWNCRSRSPPTELFSDFGWHVRDFYSDSCYSSDAKDAKNEMEEMEETEDSVCFLLKRRGVEV